MSYPKQLTVLRRLERETRTEMRALEDRHAQQLVDIWKYYKKSLAGVVMGEYHHDFGRGKWNVTAAVRAGTLDRIRNQTQKLLGEFHFQAHRHIYEGLRDVVEHETLRALWMLDCVTPPSFKPRAPGPSTLAREADGGKSPNDYEAKWDSVLANWIQAYEDSFAANLRLEAMHESGIQDAAAEVDATRIDNFNPEYKFGSLFSTEAIKAQELARWGVSAENDDMVADEVLLTLEDARVCDECDDYDGKSLSDIGDRPPYHFCCRCYTSIVPKAWSQMLGYGDENEQKAALLYEERGLVPSAMAVLGDDGRLEATATVTFKSWLEGNTLTIIGGR